MRVYKKANYTTRNLEVLAHEEYVPKFSGTIAQLSAENERKCLITGQKYLQSKDGTTIGWCHLSGLVAEAKRDSKFANLPWNLGNMVNAHIAPGSYPRFVSINGAKRVVNEVRRFCGWLRAAPKFRALKKVVERTQSSRGVWSPRTTLHLWSFANKFPSPGKLERKLWSVRKRTDKIFSAFSKGGRKVSWAAIAQGLMVSDQRGKAAVVAVAVFVSGKNFKSYRQAREWLVEYHKCSVLDESDGVVVHREIEPQLNKMGIRVYKARMPKLTRRGKQVGIELLFLVCSSDGRTYHAKYAWNARRALRVAIEAWKERDKLAQIESDLVDFLEGGRGFCPLVVRLDSYRAGNCSVGTESWLRERGWGERKFIPGIWLREHFNHPLVKNVAKKLCSSFV